MALKVSKFQQDAGGEGEGPSCCRSILCPDILRDGSAGTVKKIKDVNFDPLPVISTSEVETNKSPLDLVLRDSLLRSLMSFWRSLHLTKLTNSWIAIKISKTNFSNWTSWLWPKGAIYLGAFIKQKSLAKDANKETIQ